MQKNLEVRVRGRIPGIYGGFPEFGVPFWGFPKMGFVAFLGLYWGSRLWGEYPTFSQNELAELEGLGTIQAGSSSMK